MELEVHLRQQRPGVKMTGQECRVVVEITCGNSQSNYQNVKIGVENRPGGNGRAEILSLSSNNGRTFEAKLLLAERMNS